MKGQRGRRSAASLQVVPLLLGKAAQRKRPPSELTKEQGRVWDAVVAAMPGGWFDGANGPLLIQYCRHVCAARAVAAELAALREEIVAKAAAEQVDVATMSLRCVKALDRLLKMQERESSAIASLATKMRLSQQSTRSRRGNDAAEPAPWEL